MIIVNTSPSIKESSVITIRTKCESEWVQIEIGYNGVRILSEDMTYEF